MQTGWAKYDVRGERKGKVKVIQNTSIRCSKSKILLKNNLVADALIPVLMNLIDKIEIFLENFDRLLCQQKRRFHKRVV